jgi:two-component system response regulator
MSDRSPDILLVEDSHDDSAFFRHALGAAAQSVRLHIVHDGVEALDYLFNSGDPGTAQPSVVPRLIVLDLKMPRIGGLEVLRRLKANPHTRAIPAIVLSSSLERRDLSESYCLGVNSYLLKPLDFDEYTQLIYLICRYWLHLNKTSKT